MNNDTAPRGRAAVCAGLVAAALALNAWWTPAAGTAAAAAAGACQGTLNWPVLDSPTATPVTSPLLSTVQLTKLLFNNLVRYDRNLKPAPDLAASWEPSADLKTWTFHLRRGVRWHDGQPFTADDVVFSITAYAKVPTSYYKSYFSTFQSAEAVDPSTVRLVFQQPIANLPQLLAYNIAMVPKHVLAGVDLTKPAAFIAHPVGTGPFQFASEVPNSYYRVVRNPQYFAGPVRLCAVNLKVVPDPDTQIAQVESGALDFATITPQQTVAAKNHPNVTIHKAPLVQHVFMSLLNTDPLFSDPRTRWALAMAIDRQGIVDKLLLGEGTVATGPIAPAVRWAYPIGLRPLPYDVAGARKLLAEVGWTPGPGGILQRDGKPLSFAITYWNSSVTTDLAPVVQQYLGQLGADVKLDLLDFATAVAKVRAHRYQAALYWGTTPADPDVTSYYGTGAASNIMGYSNRQVDQLLTQGRATFGDNRRAVIYAQAQRLIMQDQPVVFLYYPVEVQLVAKRLNGMPDLDFRNALNYAAGFWIGER